jgi:hypothetical protein
MDSATVVAHSFFGANCAHNPVLVGESHVELGVSISWMEAVLVHEHLIVRIVQMRAAVVGAIARDQTHTGYTARLDIDAQLEHPPLRSEECMFLSAVV